MTDQNNKKSIVIFDGNKIRRQLVRTYSFSKSFYQIELRTCFRQAVVCQLQAPTPIDNLAEEYYHC